MSCCVNCNTRQYSTQLGEHQCCTNVSCCIVATPTDIVHKLKSYKFLAALETYLLLYFLLNYIYRTDVSNHTHSYIFAIIFLPLIKTNFYITITAQVYTSGLYFWWVTFRYHFDVHS